VTELLANALTAALHEREVTVKSKLPSYRYNGTYSHVKQFRLYSSN